MLNLQHDHWTFTCPFCGTDGMALDHAGYCPDCDERFDRKDVEGEAGDQWLARVTEMQFAGGMK